jgi:hypothetical protein
MKKQPTKWEKSLVSHISPMMDIKDMKELNNNKTQITQFKNGQWS